MKLGPTTPATPPTPPGHIQSAEMLPQDLAQEFQTFKQDLISSFEKWERSHRFISELDLLDKKVTLRRLNAIVKEMAVLESPSARNIPESSFERKSKDAIGLIRGTCLYLHLEGKNPHGFSLGSPELSLLNENSEIGWSLEPAHLEGLRLEEFRKELREMQDPASW